MRSHPWEPGRPADRKSPPAQAALLPAAPPGAARGRAACWRGRRRRRQWRQRRAAGPASSASGRPDEQRTASLSTRAKPEDLLSRVGWPTLAPLADVAPRSSIFQQYVHTSGVKGAQLYGDKQVLHPSARAWTDDRALATRVSTWVTCGCAVMAMARACGRLAYTGRPALACMGGGTRSARTAIGAVGCAKVAAPAHHKKPTSTMLKAQY